jgi:hypothetical protein
MLSKGSRDCRRGNESDFRALITHRIPLRDALRCYQLVDQGATELMQVLIDYRAS